MAAAVTELVIALRMGYQQALHAPTDRFLKRLDQEMIMVAHQATLKRFYANFSWLYGELKYQEVFWGTYDTIQHA